VKSEPITKLGTLTEYKDLWNREAKRTGFKWRDKPEEYSYVAKVSPNKKVTCVELHYLGEYFIGAGVAIRNPIDKFHEESGIRLAMSRALHSIHYHNNGNGRKKKREED
jgi:hypothetical protein